MTFKYSHDEQERREPKLIFLAHTSSPCTQILAWLSIRFSMLPNLTNQYISYSMAVFSANEIRTFFVIISYIHFVDFYNHHKDMTSLMNIFRIFSFNFCQMSEIFDTIVLNLSPNIFSGSDSLLRLYILLVREEIN